ncbi:hypothetical protein JYU14_05130 [Simkania negevensis]|uniref:Uncharacterized protein n=1 Tax=Simkania negevensis TaxID=83561 RepID=A0ABS3AV34_9BACT|nr:hypothetical protein [Simkania negevensis]
MTTLHTFIFSPGTWEVDGTISFNLPIDELVFAATWNVTHKEGTISAIQEVFVEGMSEKMINRFTITNVTNNRFAIELKNGVFGQVKGKGVKDNKKIAWELKGGEGHIEGFEVYEQKSEELYTVHAEYTSSDQCRTIIIGSLKFHGLKPA